jgi:hypothetical protein
VKRLDSSLAAFESVWATPLALAVGLALRLLVLESLRDVPLRADASIYFAMALQLLRGESFEPYHPPGLSFLLLPAHALFGDSERVARAAMIAIWLATSLLLRAQTRALAGPRAANLAVACFALYPTCIWLSVEPLTQLPTAACLLAIAWLAPALVTRPRIRSAVALGLATGELALIRPSALPFLLAVPIYLAARGAGARAAGVTFAVGALCVGAWLADARAMTGRFVAINDANSLNFFIGNNAYTPLYKTWWFGSHAAGERDVPEAYSVLEREIAGLPPAGREARYRAEALSHIAARPDLFALRTFNRVRVYFALDSSTAGWLRLYGLVGTAGAIAVIAAEALFYLAFVSGALLACLAPPGDAERRERLAVAVVAGLLYALPYFVAFSHPTYHFPVVALALSLAAGLVENVAREPDPGPLARLWAAPSRRLWALAGFAALALIQLEWLARNADRLG